MSTTSSITFSATYVARIHTLCAYTAFLSALALGLLLHYKKIVKNEVAGFPDEWWPSVSATIGDWYPERNIFQILIALTSGPRFALVCCWYLVTRTPQSTLPNLVLTVGLLRTISCGGWVYVTSSDDSFAHDVLMISYIVLNIPWMIGSILSTKNAVARRRRKLVAWSFFGALIPMAFLYVRHKVHRVPGAYTHYSFFEWFLIFSDVYFDSITKIDLESLEISLSVPTISAGGVKIIPKLNTTSQSYAPAVSTNPASTVVSEPKAQVNGSQEVQYSQKQTWRPLFSFTADVYLSYVWWSILTSLAPSLFYFSVWELSIAGTEAALFTLLSPFVLSIQPIRLILQTHQGRVTLHALSLIGLLAFLSPVPMTRLLLVGLATTITSINQAIAWSVDDAWKNGTVLMLGLMASSVSKLLNHSNNPIWPIVNSLSGGRNELGLALSLLAIYEFGTRPLYLSQSPKTEATTPTPGSWLIPSLSLGSLLFSLHYFLTDTGILIAWSWTGYPVKGPVAGIHNSLVVLSMSIGILLASFPATYRAVSSPGYLSFGAAALYALYACRNWLGFAGGLCYAIFLCSVTPAILASTSKSFGAEGQRLGKVLGTSWLVYVIFLLMDVWTVAYAFVPGGNYLRERTDLVLICHFCSIILGFVSVDRVRLNTAALRMMTRNALRAYSQLFMMLITVIAILKTLSNLPVPPPRPYHTPERLITAGIWTVHFGIDLEGRDSQRRIRDLVKDMELDILGLLETDLNRVVFGNRDLTKIVAETLGYYVDLGPGPNSHTWGAVLFSKYPIINSTHHLLPSPHGELAPAISAILDVWGTEVMVVVAHNGQEEDQLDRELQSTELARIMSDVSPMPVIFLGYVVTRPHAPRPAPYEILVNDGRVHDVDRDDTDRWCEYILYRGLYRTGYGRVARSTVTDTELQLAKFVLPRHGTAVTNETDGARYLRSRKESLPERWWFNDSYYGNEQTGGIRGHFWHVFGTPLYYQVPEDALL